MKISHSDIENIASGRKLDFGKFSELATWNETGYAVYNSTWMSDHESCERFGLTPRLYDHWMYYGIEFNLYLELNGDIITRCILDKFRTSETARPVTKALTPTQQELRIARRILDHITK